MRPSRDATGRLLPGFTANPRGRPPGRFSRDTGVAERSAAALEAVAPFLGPPALRPAGPVLLVPRGAALETTMADHPLGKDAIFPVVPADYDGDISWSVEGNDSVTAEADPGSPRGVEGRATLNEGVEEGDSYTMVARADVRHGSGVVTSEHRWEMTVVAADASPVTAAGDPRFVDPGAPAS